MLRMIIMISRQTARDRQPDRQFRQLGLISIGAETHNVDGIWNSVGRQTECLDNQTFSVVVMSIVHLFFTSKKSIFHFQLIESIIQFFEKLTFQS